MKNRRRENIKKREEIDEKNKKEIKEKKKVDINEKMEEKRGCKSKGMTTTEVKKET